MDRVRAMMTTLRVVDSTAFARLADTWHDVESRAQDPHYSATHQWLSAWMAAYAPRRLTHVEISGDRGLAAVGLLEHLALRRLRFAGAPVSPRGCLVVADGQNAAAWSAFSAALTRQRPRWSVLHCAGAPGVVASLPRALAVQTPEYALTLPAAFDDYVAGLSQAARKSARQKLRRIAKAGEIEECDPGDHAAAVQRFLELHRLRAEQRGECHPDMDARLRRLLLSLPEHGTGTRLRVFELRVEGAVVATTVRLDHRATAFFYNGGFDPVHARLSPGISMELASIRDAIERGCERFDLGPGHYRYKTDLGGVPHSRYRAALGGPSVPAAAIPLARLVRDRVARARTAVKL